MTYRLLAGAVIAALSINHAAADMVITVDTGGSINAYTHRYAMARASGEQVVIDGLCFSACTIALSMLPRGQVCVTQNALLGFHAAWNPSAGGRVTSAGHTHRLFADYPPPIRNWIARRGGLSSEMIYLYGRELRALVPACNANGTTVARATKRPPANLRREAAADHSP